MKIDLENGLITKGRQKFDICRKKKYLAILREFSKATNGFVTVEHLQKKLYPYANAVRTDSRGYEVVTGRQRVTKLISRMRWDFEKTFGGLWFISSYGKAGWAITLTEKISYKK